MAVCDHLELEQGKDNCHKPTSSTFCRPTPRQDHREVAEERPSRPAGVCRGHASLVRHSVAMLDGTFRATAFRLVVTERAWRNADRKDMGVKASSEHADGGRDRHHTTDMDGEQTYIKYSSTHEACIGDKDSLRQKKN
ncbi:hypothetical protein Bbelb_126450 [Branchiostoma belcheri]|nr:hypothetical protein Bbelb_126450 [Branchiostoma belcheri]